MAMSAAGLGFLFTAKDLASAKINTVNKSLVGLAATSDVAAKKYMVAMASIKSGAKSLAVGAVGLLALNAASKSFETFEKALVSAGTIMGATSSELRELKKAAIEAGIKTQFSPTEAVQGLESLGAAGLTAAESIKVLNPVLSLAAASLGQLGVAEAAQVAVGVMNAFGETTETAAKRVDQLVRITQRSSFQARDFNVALSQASAQAKSADQSFESMVATLGLLRNTSLDASSAATSYREAVRRVSGDLRAQKMLRKLNVDVLDQETGKIKDLSKIITEMQPKLADLNAKERNLYLTKIFGVRGQKAYNAVMAGYEKLLKQGKVRSGDFAAAHRLLVGELNNSAGAAENAKNAFLKTAAGQRTLLKGSWETFKIMAGENISKTLVPALISMVGALNKVIKFIDKMNPMVKTMISEFALFAAGALALVGTLKILKGAFGLMTMGSSLAIKSTGRLSRGLAGVGRAMPLIGIAAAGLGVAYRALTADSRALKASQLSKAEAEKAIQEKLGQAYAASAKAASEAGVKAESAAAKMARQSESSAATSKKNLLIIEGNMAKAFATGTAAAKKLADAERDLATFKDPATRRRAADQKARAEREWMVAQKIIQANKYAAARIRGIDAERKLKFPKDSNERLRLRKVAAAGRLIQSRRLARLALQEKSKLAGTPKELSAERARIKGQLKMYRERRNSAVAEAAALAGVAKGTRGRKDQTRISSKFAGGALGETRAFGAERNKFLAALTAPGGPTVPQGLGEAGLKRFKTFAASGVAEAAVGGENVSPGATGMLLARVDRLIDEQRKGREQDMLLARRGRMQDGGPVNVIVQVDGQEIVAASNRSSQEDADETGRNTGGGAA